MKQQPPRKRAIASAKLYRTLAIALLCTLLLGLSPNAQARRGGIYRKPRGKYIGLRGGVGMAGLRFERKPAKSLPIFSYSFGAQGLFLLPHSLEVVVAIQLLRQGGRAESYFTYEAGDRGKALGRIDRTDNDLILDAPLPQQEGKLTYGAHYFVFDLPALVNYRFRLGGDFRMFVGAGFDLSLAFFGEAYLKNELGKESLDMDFGYSKSDTFTPIDLGLIAHTGVRYEKMLEASLWYKIDFLNRNTNPSANVPNLDPTYSLVHPTTNALMHSRGKIHTMSGGITIAYYLPLNL
ncbi:MAG: hypothetical protein CSA97_00510 [Bacteroidetes bacterium]|nr:MAG: hypothetical protein CSA97_00510 [Bacteroidota bacterium]